MVIMFKSGSYSSPRARLPEENSSPRARLPEENRFSPAKIQGSDAPVGQVLRNQAERNSNSQAERV